MSSLCPAPRSPAVQAPPAPAAATGLPPLFALAIGFIMAMLDVTIVNVALPSIAAQFGTPLSGLVWIVDGYTLTFAAFLLAAGALSDRYGAKAVYLAGLAVFTVASLLCGAAPDTAMLVAARLLQGLGAALFMPSSLSLLAHAYQDEHERGRMLAAWATIITTAASAGPLVGGLLISLLGWRSIFLLNLPLGLLGLWLAQKRLASPAPRPRPVDPMSHLLGIATLGSACFTLVQGNVYGWVSARILAAAALAVLLGTALVVRERRHPHPIVPRALLATPGYLPANAYGFLASFTAYGLIFLLSLYMQQALGATPLQAGLRLLPMLAAFTLGNLASGRLVARWGAPAVMMAGAALGAMSSIALCLAYTPESPYLLLLALVGLGNLAAGAAIPAMTGLAMRLGGHAGANSASALLNTNRQAGTLVGVAIVGTTLHALPDWHASLPVALGMMGFAYVANMAIVLRYLLPRAGQAAATP